MEDDDQLLVDLQLEFQASSDIFLVGFPPMKPSFNRLGFSSIKAVRGGVASPVCQVRPDSLPPIDSRRREKHSESREGIRDDIRGIPQPDFQDLPIA